MGGVGREGGINWICGCVLFGWDELRWWGGWDGLGSWWSWLWLAAGWGGQGGWVSGVKGVNWAGQRWRACVCVLVLVMVVAVAVAVVVMAVGVG